MYHSHLGVSNTQAGASEEGKPKATTKWPVGQVVKTAASHAANMGSIPVRVTTFWLTRREKFDKLLLQQRVGVDCSEGPPVPIPNTEVKLTCAEDTCLETNWENR